MSFLAPNEANVVNTAKKCEKKVVPSPATGRSRLDSLMGDGHISRKEGGSGTSNTAVLPRVKSFRTELDLFSINFAGQNAACIPSMEEFKDNPFELDVNDLVDECVFPESDENFLNSPRSSSAVAALPQMEMQQQQQREGDNNNDGSNCDTSNSNPVFSLKERSMGGGNDDSKKRGRIKTDEMKMGPTPIVTDPEIHIPVNVWQPIEKELGKDMKITAAAYGIPEQQTGTQPVQEGTNEQQSSIVMGINSLSFLFDSPCFSVLELDECIKSFSPPIQTGWRTLDVPSPLPPNQNGYTNLEYPLLHKDSNQYAEKLSSQQYQLFTSKKPTNVEDSEGKGQMNPHSPPLPSVDGTAKRQTSEEVSKRLPVSVLEKYYHLPLCRASEELKVSLTMLKKLCRQYGLTRWPHRQVSSLNKSITKHEEKLKGCKEKEHTAQIRAKIVNLKTKRALINKSASTGLNTDVLNAVFAAKPGEVDEMEIIRTGNFSQLANLVKAGNSANQHTQLQGGKQSPNSIQTSLAFTVQNNSTAPVWAWQKQQQQHTAAQNGFASGEFQELEVDNNTHHNVRNQDCLPFPSLVEEKNTCDLEPSTAYRKEVTNDEVDIFSNMLKKFSV
eukprot:104839_1